VEPQHNFRSLKYLPGAEPLTTSWKQPLTYLLIY